MMKAPMVKKEHARKEDQRKDMTHSLPQGQTRTQVPELASVSTLKWLGKQPVFEPQSLIRKNRPSLAFFACFAWG